jgi:hypothetical protein
MPPLLAHLGMDKYIFLRERSGKGGQVCTQES